MGRRPLALFFREALVPADVRQARPDAGGHRAEGVILDDDIIDEAFVGGRGGGVIAPVALATPSDVGNAQAVGGLTKAVARAGDVTRSIAFSIVTKRLMVWRPMMLSRWLKWRWLIASRRSRSRGRGGWLDVAVVLM